MNFGRKAPRSLRSYAQAGEDLIVAFVLCNILNIARPNYLDLGAYHPITLSNTYYFYQKGCSGVCVEANPKLCDEIRRHRKRDICLNCGVGVDSVAEADFFVMEPPTLSTFSLDEVRQHQQAGHHRLVNIIKLPILSANEIVKRHFNERLDFLSVDIEGNDLELLRSLDLTTIVPTVICVETLTYAVDKTERKKVEIIDYLRSVGYFVYGDTWINTIFVSSEKWRKR